MDTTVVFFPGMGYGVDRPLFYYARKQAQQTGSEVVCVDYPSFSPDPSVPAPLQAQAALPGCVNDALAQGCNVVLEIDVQGALQIFKRRPDAISVFIAPPSLGELRRRLSGRGDTAPEVADLRLHIALQECTIAEQYQYIIINDSVAHAADELCAILTAEACRPQYRKIQLKEEV